MKLAPAALPYLKFFLLFLGAFLLLYFMLYAATHALPKFISNQTNRPVIYNWGREDTWTKEQDIELYIKYNKLNDDWLNDYESYYKLAGEEPDDISGNDTDKDTVNEVWGEYMALDKKRPLINAKHDEIFREKAEEYNIDPEFLKSIAWAGSKYNTQYTQGSYLGITALPKNKVDDYNIEHPFKPAENIGGGARYLSKLSEQFGSKEKIAAAYRCGTNTVKEHGGVPPITDVKEFVRTVMKVYKDGEILVPESGKNTSIASTRQQAEQYSVPWSVMASLDRILGDPVIHGGIKRKPSPEKHFEALKPELKWKDFELYYYEKEKITYTTTNSEGEEVTKTRTEIEEYAHTIKLLTRADAYNARFTHNWEKKVIEDEVDTEDYYRYEKIIVPELKSVTRQGPYYKPVREILKEHGLHSDMKTELVTRMAMSLDPAFEPDAGAMNSLLEITWDTSKSYYSGSASGFIRPVDGRVTSGYGYRIHPITNQYSFHSGIDIGAPKGREVVASEKGLVVLARRVSDYGKTVIIDHGDYKTLYAHLSSIKVKRGDEVDQGEKIGEVGSTGRSTGPHLHFEIRKGSEFVNPADFF